MRTRKEIWRFYSQNMPLSAWWHQPCIDSLVPYFITFQFWSYNCTIKVQNPMLKFNDWIASIWMCACGMRWFCSFFKFHRFSSIYLLAGGTVCVFVCVHAVIVLVCDAKVRRKMAGYNYILLLYFGVLIQCRWAIFVLFCHYIITLFRKECLNKNKRRVLFWLYYCNTNNACLYLYFL